MWNSRVKILQFVYTNACKSIIREKRSFLYLLFGNLYCSKQIVRRRETKVKLRVKVECLLVNVRKIWLMIKFSFMRNLASLFLHFTPFITFYTTLRIIRINLFNLAWNHCGIIIITTFKFLRISSKNYKNLLHKLYKQIILNTTVSLNSILGILRLFLLLCLALWKHATHL